MSNIKHLVVSNTNDYSTDLICYEFEKRGQSYLRINRDRFSKYHIVYDLQKDWMQIDINDESFVITADDLQSIYFRAPVFLRTSKPYTVQEQLSRSQWSSFIRNLIIFDKSKWLNHPVSIYQAENKLYQLKLAKRLGLDIPETFLGNVLPKLIDLNKKYAVKSLDTALFYENGKEMFTYTNIISAHALQSSNIQDAPIILQECLENKTDIRVTVIGNKILAVRILKNGRKIDGDWRQTSTDELNYECVKLPNDLENKILRLMRNLNLEFGGIDLALVNEKYYFIEVNPTGEWGWLVSTTNRPIDKIIVDCLEGDLDK